MSATLARPGRRGYKTSLREEVQGWVASWGCPETPLETRL
jgi:hypothetical protein